METLKKEIELQHLGWQFILFYFISFYFILGQWLSSSINILNVL